MRWFFHTRAAKLINMQRTGQTDRWEHPLVPLLICRMLQQGSAGKPAVVRRVLKEGPNNGRHFYACPATKKVIGGGSIPNPLCRPPVTVNIRSVN